MAQQTLLTIGAGPGMGLATAERFGREGWRVVLASRSQTNATKYAEQLAATGIDAHGYAVDATDASALAAFIDRVADEHDGIDTLHYNAASMRNETLLEQPKETFADDLNVNIGGALVASQAATRHMLTQTHGTILLTGGGFSLNPLPDYLSLSIGKAGIRNLTQALSEELKQNNIHVATVTVNMFVDPGSDDAAAVAEAFWQLQNQSKHEWDWEVTVPSQS